METVTATRRLSSDVREVHNQRLNVAEGCPDIKFFSTINMKMNANKYISSFTIKWKQLCNKIEN
jgi:hypothetical protein